MKTMISAAALAAALGLCAAPAFAQPSGGPDAKGNAPLKHAHTVNDGAAKHGRNSFTEGQARRHIEKAGFTGVTGLAKGDDGVWRGQAMRDGQATDVAMDFKGNVSTSAGSTPPPAQAAPAPMGAPASASGAEQTAATSSATSDKPVVHHRRRHHAHHAMNRCADPTPDGAACSGVDKNHNGISDKEDHAIAKGAKP